MEITNDVGCVTFRQVRYSKCFIDKTLFIEDVLARKVQVMLITTPPRFGKTIKLSMVEEYLGKRIEDNVPYRNPFEGTAIWNKPDLKIHFQKYIVIRITLCGAPKSYVDAINCLRDAVCASFFEHRYLNNSDKFDSMMKQLCYKWSNPITAKTMDLESGLTWLRNTLKLHHGPDAKFVILVDEFDQIVSNLMFWVEDELEKIISKRDSILKFVKHHAENILFSLLTGVADVTWVSGSLINNDQKYLFLQNEFFFRYYILRTIGK